METDRENTINCWVLVRSRKLYYQNNTKKVVAQTFHVASICQFGYPGNITMNRGRQFESCKYKQINEKILFCHRCMNTALATNSVAKTKKSKSSII